jgi:hypothetical protein
MSIKKPGDETTRGLPDVSMRREDSFVGRARVSLGDIKKAAAEVAPEVSQGAWRERVFTPRAVMSREDIVAGLKASLRTALATANHPRVAFDAVRGAWLPMLRQALEQAGGDGIDAWLQVLFAFPGKVAKQVFFAELADGLARMRSARDLVTFENEATAAAALVDAALGAAPVKLSFKQMERHLEGKLEVDELLVVRAGVDDDLRHRLGEIDGTMSQLREQIRKLPGKQPDGMYANFVRLKAELRVLDAELRRRAGTLQPPSSF